MIPDSQDRASQPIDITGAKKALRGDEPRWEWIACNEVTRKLADHALPALYTNPHGAFPSIGSPQAVGWAMLIEGKGWFGRVRDERGDWSFGPSTLGRAQQAVRAYLRHEDFPKTETEKSWRSDAWRLVAGENGAGPNS
jgi:hypothetical protein